MPVLARRRDESGEPVQKLKRREFDDAIGSRPCGLAAADHEEPTKGEGGPGAVSQQVLAADLLGLRNEAAGL